MATKLSKQFVIRLTDKDVSISKEYAMGGAPVIREYNIRETEIRMLINLFEMASSNQKDFRKMNQCADCIGHLENLTDTERNVLLTEQDFKFLTIGMEKSVDQRPPIWSQLKTLIQQLAKPVEYSEPPLEVE